MDTKAARALEVVANLHRPTEIEVLRRGYAQIRKERDDAQELLRKITDLLNRSIEPKKNRTLSKIDNLSQIEAQFLIRRIYCRLSAHDFPTLDINATDHDEAWSDETAWTETDED